MRKKKCGKVEMKKQIKQVRKGQRRGACLKGGQREMREKLESCREVRYFNVQGKEWGQIVKRLTPYN